MKTFNIRQIALFLLGALLISFSATSCTKDGASPGGGGVKAGDYGTHNVDPQLAGDWMWTSGSDLGYYDDNGTWKGDGYGFAWRVSMDAKGNGTLYSHIHSNMYGTVSQVDIYYKGYYEQDANGNMTFYSMGGRYVSNITGVDRALEGDEIYNPSTGNGRTITFGAVSVTTQNGRDCFLSVPNDTETDIFFKL